MTHFITLLTDKNVEIFAAPLVFNIDNISKVLRDIDLFLI